MAVSMAENDATKRSGYDSRDSDGHLWEPFSNQQLCGNFGAGHGKDIRSVSPGEGGKGRRYRPGSCHHEENRGVASGRYSSEKRIARISGLYPVVEVYRTRGAYLA